MERKRVDFHVHYDPKKPVQSGVEMIQTAAECGVVAMGLLARNKVGDWFPELIDYGREYGVEIIPGVETTVLINNIPADLICLGFDYMNPKIRELFDNTKRDAEVAFLQKTFLEGCGFSFDSLPEDQNILLHRLLNGEIAEKAISFCEILASSPVNSDVVNAFINTEPELKGKITEELLKSSNYQGEKNKLKINAKILYNILFHFGTEGFEFVRSRRIQKAATLEQVIQTVHAAGGVVLYSPEGNFDYDVWLNIKNAKIDGIMAWHGMSMTKEKTEDIRKCDTPIEVVKDVQKWGLVLGGSDAQGKDWVVGRGNGEMFISPRRLKELHQYLQSM